jgi:hypothetical protein
MDRADRFHINMESLECPVRSASGQTTLLPLIQFQNLVVRQIYAKLRRGTEHSIALLNILWIHFTLFIQLTLFGTVIGIVFLLILSTLFQGSTM